METTIEKPKLRAVLAKNQMPALRALEVAETDCSVVLTGRVSSFYEKQMAQEAVRRVVHGRTIVNQIEVA